MRNERGETLISALIAVVIVGLIAMLLASVYEQASIQSARSNYMREIDNFVRQLGSFVQNEDACSAGLRNTDFSKITWDGRVAQNVGRIELAAGMTLASDTMTPNPNLRVRSIVIRPHDTNGNDIVDGNESNNDGFITRSIESGNVVTYRTIPGELAVEFEIITPDAATTGGRLAERNNMVRSVPILVAVNLTTGVIDRCGMNDDSRQMLDKCTSLMAQVDGDACQGPLPPRDHIAKDCKSYPYVKGINPLGEPVCACAYACMYRRYFLVPAVPPDCVVIATPHPNACNPAVAAPDYFCDKANRHTTCKHKYLGGASCPAGQYQVDTYVCR